MTYRILNPGYDNNSLTFTRGFENLLHSTNGDDYIDMAMGAGSLILGHAQPSVVEAIKEQASKSSIFLQNNDVIQELSEEVSNSIPFFLPNHIYCNSGSEATQRAIRLARAATGKMHVASFQGGWHGMNEWTLLDDGGRFGQSTIQPYTGIPEIALQYTKLLPYNDDSIWKTLEHCAHQLAAIIIEPIQGSNPQIDISSYLSKLTDECHRLGILVIYDEIITGFRLCKGGAAQKFNLKPDIVTYGKVLGGGLPLGMVAFTDEVHHNTFAQPEKNILTGGTFSANPLSAAAGLATLRQLNISTYSKIEKLGYYFRYSLNHEFCSRNIPFSANGVDSVNRVYFTDKPIKNRTERDRLELCPKKQAQFRLHLWKNKVIWPANGIICLPVSQTTDLLNQVIEKVVEAAEWVLRDE